MDQGERVTVKELAEQLGISKTAVQKRADALGIVFAKEGKRGTRTATQEQAEAIREAIRGTDLGADQDEQINIFEIIDDPEPSEAEPKKSPKKPKTERTQTEHRTKEEQKEPDATGAAIEALREQLKAKDEQIERLQILLSQAQQLAAQAQAQAAALLPAPGAADPEGATDQEPEQPAQAPTPEQPKGGTIWERIKAYFRG